MELFAQGKIYLTVTALVILGAIAALWAQAGGTGSWTETTRWPQLAPTYTLSLKADRGTIPAGEAEVGIRIDIIDIRESLSNRFPRSIR